MNVRESLSEAESLVSEIRRAGGRASVIQADMSRVSEVRGMFAELSDRFGRLDVLVANAGYCVFRSIAETSEEDFERIFAVNARGTFFCLQEAIRRMSHGGRIICVSTIGTRLHLEGGAAYFGSKAAIEQFCHVLGREGAPRGITVNVVSPGFVETRMLAESLDPSGSASLVDMTPLGRLGAPEDISEVIAFLAGQERAWITRQNLAVDGGIVSR